MRLQQTSLCNASCDSPQYAVNHMQPTTCSQHYEENTTVQQKQHNKISKNSESTAMQAHMPLMQLCYYASAANQCRHLH